MFELIYNISKSNDFGRDMIIQLQTVGPEDFNDLLKRIHDDSLSPEDRSKLTGLMKGWWFFMNAFVDGSMTKAQLKRLIEKSGEINLDLEDITNKSKQNKRAKPDQDEAGPKDKNADDQPAADQQEDESVDETISQNPEDHSQDNEEPSQTDKTNPPLDFSGDAKPGHGRSSMDNFAPSQLINYFIGGLRAGMKCPSCFDGILGKYKNGRVLQIEECPPLAPVIHNVEKLRCSVCLSIFSADIGDGIMPGIGRYSFGAIAAIAVYRYSYGLPSHRLEDILKNYDLPINDATMWKYIEEGWQILQHLENALWVSAANGSLIYIDDGKGRVIEHKRAIKAELDQAKLEGGSVDTIRTGVNTTCVYVVTENGNIRLFSTGRHHCGEKFWELLESRKTDEAQPLMRMADRASTNSEKPKSSDNELSEEIIFLYCLQHARDRFFKAKENFPEPASYVLQMISQVYGFDRRCKTKALNDDARLAYHQQHSKPILQSLQSWCIQQFDERLIEPNSSMGQAITYFVKYFEDVTGFLRYPGAPLDNNLAEQTVKIEKRHLKASQSYLTKRGAEVGDCYMSVISSAKLFDLQPISYLTKCFEHGELLKKHPEKFLPWNFSETVKSLEASNFRLDRGPPTINITTKPIAKSEVLGPDLD